MNLKQNLKKVCNLKKPVFEKRVCSDIFAFWLGYKISYS